LWWLFDAASKEKGATNQPVAWWWCCCGAMPHGSSKAMSGVAMSCMAIAACCHQVDCVFVFLLEWHHCHGHSFAPIACNNQHVQQWLGIANATTLLPFFHAMALIFILRHCTLCQGWVTVFCFVTLCTAALFVVPQHFSSCHKFFVPWHWHVSCLGIGDCVVSCCGIGNCIPWHLLLPFCVMLQHCHFPERCNTGNFLDVPFFSGKWCN